MDPEAQRLAVIVCVGLLALFPVFNQVAYAVIENLHHGNNDSRMSEFFKSWDNIPEDRKLEYWDGRNVPPGQWDGGSLSDDASIRGGAGAAGGAAGAAGTDTTTGEENGDPAVPRQRYVEEVLWRFQGSGQSRSGAPHIDNGRDYHWVNVTYDYVGFTGTATFRLLVAEQEAWRLEPVTPGPFAIFDQDRGNSSVPDVGRASLVVDHEYSPTVPPSQFEITVTGAYLESY